MIQILNMELRKVGNGGGRVDHGSTEARKGGKLRVEG
jgi:hypothetical protein